MNRAGFFNILGVLRQFGRIRLILSSAILIGPILPGPSAYPAACVPGTPGACLDTTATILQCPGECAGDPFTNPGQADCCTGCLPGYVWSGGVCIPIPPAPPLPPPVSPPPVVPPPVSPPPVGPPSPPSPPAPPSPPPPPVPIVVVPPPVIPVPPPPPVCNATMEITYTIRQWDTTTGSVPVLWTGAPTGMALQTVTVSIPIDPQEINNAQYP